MYRAHPKTVSFDVLGGTVMSCAETKRTASTLFFLLALVKDGEVKRSPETKNQIIKIQCL